MRKVTCPICKSEFETNHGRQVYCHGCRSFPKNGRAVVYALHTTGNSDIYYIGSTTNPVKRYMEHRANGPVDMSILEIVPARKAKKSEQRHIYKHKKAGNKLKNRRRAGRMFSSKEAHDFIADWLRR